MPVLVSAEVPGQTAQGYDAIREHLAMALRQAPGFVLHTSHAIDGVGALSRSGRRSRRRISSSPSTCIRIFLPVSSLDARSRSCTASCGPEASGRMEQGATSNRRISSGC